MAGRKNKYTVDYFPHYCNGESKTMFILENKFGLVGYAVWYKTLELLGKSDKHFIDLRDDTDKLFLISKLGITEQVFTEIYDLLAKLNAIDIDLWNSKVVFSDNFVSNIEDAYVRRKGINVLHKYDLCKHLLIKCKQKLPKESKVKKSKVKKSKVNKIDFLDFWNLYNKKVGSKEKAKKKWNLLPLETQKKIIETIPNFKKGKEKTYLPHPITYLNNERWNDEIEKAEPTDVDRFYKNIPR